MADSQLSVKSRSYFRGEPSEGTDGMVAPGDVLKVSRARGADLKANGLVDVIADAAPDAPLAAQVTAAEAKPTPITTETAKAAAAPASAPAVAIAAATKPVEVKK